MAALPPPEKVVTPQKFIAKWQRVQLSERSACHQHFLDLCDLLGQPKPADGANLDILRRVFNDPQSLKPGITSESMTVEAAKRFPALVRLSQSW